MKLFLAVFALALSVSAQPAAPADAAHTAKLADIHQLMKLTGGDKIADQMFQQMAASVRANGGPGGTSAEAFLNEFRKEIDYKKLENIVTEAYDKNLSAEDIKGLIRFYESPTGKHMLEAMPKINADMFGQIMPMSQEIAERVMRKMREQQLLQPKP